MITPVNAHILIDPVVHQGFISSQKESFEEIGVVVDYDVSSIGPNMLTKGSKVYFDSWLAAKYPKEGKDGEYYWLVRWEDVRAVERV